MDISRNHLVSAEMFAEMEGPERERYTVVPEHLTGPARRLLGNRKEVHVSRAAANPVAKWAAEKRRAKRQMQRQSRKRNRA
jgi:hypothetical protein